MCAMFASDQSKPSGASEIDSFLTVPTESRSPRIAKNATAAVPLP